MKKIFTFLFFAGLMTGAMAQNSRNAQYRNQNNTNQPAAYANNGQGYGQSNGGYNHPNQGNNGYNHNNENVYVNNRRLDERNEDRRFRDNDRFNQRVYGYERKREFERYNRGRFNARFSLRYGQSSCY